MTSAFLIPLIWYLWRRRTGTALDFFAHIDRVEGLRRYGLEPAQEAQP